MRLIDGLRYHRDALAALESYGNGNGSRAAAVRHELDVGRAQAPAEIALLRAEADALDEADATARARELRGEADLLDDFLAGRPDPAPASSRRGRRHA